MYPLFVSRQKFHSLMPKIHTSDTFPDNEIRKISFEINHNQVPNRYYHIWDLLKIGRTGTRRGKSYWGTSKTVIHTPVWRRLRKRTGSHTRYFFLTHGATKCAWKRYRKVFEENDTLERKEVFKSNWLVTRPPDHVSMLNLKLFVKKGKNRRIYKIIWHKCR